MYYPLDGLNKGAQIQIVISLLLSISLFVVNYCYPLVSQIVFERSSHSGIPVFPTAIAQTKLRHVTGAQVLSLIAQ